MQAERGNDGPVQRENLKKAAGRADNGQNQKKKRRSTKQNATGSLAAGWEGGRDKANEKKKRNVRAGDKKDRRRAVGQLGVGALESQGRVGWIGTTTY